MKLRKNFKITIVFILILSLVSFVFSTEKIMASSFEAKENKTQPWYAEAVSYCLKNKLLS